MTLAKAVECLGRESTSRRGEWFTKSRRKSTQTCSLPTPTVIYELGESASEPALAQLGLLRGGLVTSGGDSTFDH